MGKISPPPAASPLLLRGRTSPLTRRRFIEGLAAGTTVASLLPPLSASPARAAGHARSHGLPELTGTRFDLSVEPTRVNVTGNPRTATLVNGLMPGPILRWREGDTVTLRVTNRLRVQTSIHWHGIYVPAGMDGVPGISFRGIDPGETFVYRIPVRQSGTYWYHSHSGFQEQTLLSGPLIIAARDSDPIGADREYVIFLSDWTDEDPETVYYHLKTSNGYYNHHRLTAADFVHDSRAKGLLATLRDRFEWSTMRMDPRDILDVTGRMTGGTYTYLVNGQAPAANWTGLFRRGERVRLRFINGSSMTYFDVRIPGLGMTVVAADGSNVEPVTVDEFRIAVAETYDVVVTPNEDVYTIFAQAMDRSGYARATLAVREGLTASVPPMDPIFSRTMTDMGMSMPGMESGPRKMPGMSMPNEQGDDMPGMDMSGMDMSGMNMQGKHTSGRKMPAMQHGMSGMSDSSGAAPKARAHARPNASGQVAYPQPQEVRLALGPEVVSIAKNPTGRLDTPGDGLDGNGRRVLVYNDLVRLDGGPQNTPFVTRDPDAEVLLHLTGNMERFIFGFNGLTYDQSEPVRFPHGQRILVTLINDTMMEHPIHLHGMLTELENQKGKLRPLKHTVNVKPAEKLQYYVNATELGRWAYHCHLIYHMDAGMFTSAVVA
ncbi:MAG: copper resistance system multicopper oxidase [Gammaproteobacteria bacterium]|nr:copper resistance system multicopper oxidase [Gammaproteobacteria bacterium]